jgi:hypothetical protein
MVLVNISTNFVIYYVIFHHICIISNDSALFYTDFKDFPSSLLYLDFNIVESGLVYFKFLETLWISKGSNIFVMFIFYKIF